MMAPRPSARGAALAGVRAARIAFGRNCIVIGRVPFAAPLVHVVTHVVEAVSVGFALANRLGAGLPMPSAAFGIVWQRLRRRVAPGIERGLAASSSGSFPLGLGGEAKLSARACLQPLAVASCFVPRDSDHRLLRMIEIWIVREGRRGATCRLNEARVVGVCDLVSGEQEFVDPDAMHRPFAVLTKRITARGATHQELACRNC